MSLPKSSVPDEWDYKKPEKLMGASTQSIHVKANHI